MMIWIDFIGIFGHMNDYIDIDMLWHDGFCAILGYGSVPPEFGDYPYYIGSYERMCYGYHVEHVGRAR